MDAIIFDTETTGFEPPVEVMELAWVSFGEPVDTVFQRYYRPTKNPEWGAVATHHIFMSDLEDEAQSVNAPSNLPSVPYYIGHNVDFDWEALGKFPGKRICTLALARFLWPKLDSHKLTAVYYFLFGCRPEVRERVRRAHSALDDVLMTKEVLVEMMPLLNVSTLGGLYAASEDARIPRIMTFGKHKGKPIHEVDRGYMNWYAKQPEPDPYLIEAFRRNGF
jgi:exodeoxyribonuclease X